VSQTRSIRKPIVRVLRHADSLMIRGTVKTSFEKYVRYAPLTQICSSHSKVFRAIVNDTSAPTSDVGYQLFLIYSFLTAKSLTLVGRWISSICQSSGRLTLVLWPKGIFYTEYSENSVLLEYIFVSHFKKIILCEQTRESNKNNLMKQNSPSCGPFW
jgi:hypothetical protein